MGYDLVATEVKVDPLIRASSLWAAEQTAIEGARCLEIVDRKGEMKRGHTMAPYRNRKTTITILTPLQ
jgi:hypothetical protein